MGYLDLLHVFSSNTIPKKATDSFNWIVFPKVNLSELQYFVKSLIRNNTVKLKTQHYIAKIFKNGPSKPSKNCGRQPLKNLKCHGLL